MAIAIEKLLVQVEANSSQLQALETRVAQAFDKMRRSSISASDGIAAITKRIGLLSQGLEQSGTRQASLQRLAGIEAGLQKSLDRGNLSLSQRIRVEEQLARVQQIVATQSTATGAAVAAQGTAVNGLNERYARAALVMSGAAETMARTGKVSGEAARTILSQVTAIAFAFGPTGAIVGAVAVATLAVVNFFKRTQDEAGKTLDRLREARREAQGADLRTAAKQAAQDLAAAQRDLQEAQAGRTLETGQGGIIRLAPDDKDIAKAKARLRELEADVLDVNNAIIDKQHERFQAEAQQLAELLRSNRATNQERARAKEIIDQQRATLETLDRAQETATGAQADLIRKLRLSSQQILDVLEAPGKGLARQSEETEAKISSLLDRLRDTKQGFQDLAAGIEQPKTPAQALQTRIRELDDALAGIDKEFDRIKNKTPAQIAAFKARRQEVELERASYAELFEILRDNAAQELQRDLESLFASMTATRVDDLTLALRALLKELAERGAPAAAIEQIERIQQAVIRAVRETEQLQADLAERGRNLATIQASTSASSEEKRLAVAKELRQLRADEATEVLKIADLKFRGDRFDQARLEREKALADIRARISELIKDQTDKTGTLAERLSAIVGLASGIATAFGAGDSAAGRLLSTIGSMIGAVGQLVEASKQAGSFSKLLDSNPLVAIGGIGSIIGAAGSLLAATKGDPDAERRHQEALATLRDIERHTGDLVDRTVTGNQLGGARAATQAVLGSGRLVFDDGAVRVRDVRQLVQQLGVDFEDVQHVAREFGITLDNSLERWLELKAILDNLDFSAFKETFQGQRSQLDFDARVTGRPTSLTQFADLYGRNSPVFAEIFAGLDLTKAEDRVEAYRRIQDKWNDVLAGKELDIGDLTPEEFREGFAFWAEILRDAGVQIPETLGDVNAGIKEKVDQFMRDLEAITADFDLARLLKKFGVLDDEGVFDAMVASFKANFADLFSQIDFTDLASFRASAAKAIEGFYADGELTDAEREQIRILEQLLEAFIALEEAADPATEAFNEAVAKFRQASDAIDAMVTHGILTASEALQARIAAFRDAFGDLAADIDFSSADRFRESIKGIIAAFAADGELTEAERAQIAALETLVEAFDAATEKAESFADQLTAFFDDLSERADILDLDAAAQLREIAARVSGQLGTKYSLGDLLHDIDLDSEAGRATLKRRLQDAYRRLLSDGIDEEERPLVKAIQRMLALLVSIGDDATRALEEFARKASEAVRELLSELDFEFDLEGITDPIAKAARAIEKIGNASPEIQAALSGIADPTGTGRQAAIQALIELGRRTTNADRRAEIMTILSLLRSIPDALPEEPAAAAAEAARGAQSEFRTGVQTMTAVQADIFVDNQRTQVAILRMIEQNTRPRPEVAAALAAIAPAAPSLPLALPSLPSEIVAAETITAAREHGGTTLNVLITDRSSYEALPADLDSAAADFSDRKIEALERALADFRARRGLARGVTRVTS